MTGLKQLRNRVKSIKSTQKITKAMHVVSAAKLRKIKEQAENLNSYSMVLGNIMNDIATGSNIIDLPAETRKFFSKKLKEMTHLLVVLTSERGLCGSFNTSVIRKVKSDIEQLNNEGKQVKLLVVGKKGWDVLNAQYSHMIAGYYPNNHDTECMSKKVKNMIVELVESGEVGACYVYYNKFKNAMMQILTKDRILPAKDNGEAEKNTVSEYEYEGEELVHRIINLYISGQLNYAMLQSKASEEGARMTAMDNATNNASELVDKLTLKLNRSRQAIITTELTEIISGAEAV